MGKLRITSSRVAVGVAALLCGAVAAAGPAVAAGAAVAASAGAHVRPQTATYQEIVNYWGGLCLDAETDGIHNPGQNGDPVQLYQCAGGLNQTWDVNANGTITNVDSGKCLDAIDDATITPKTPGDRVQLWDCNGGTQQRWTQGPWWITNGYADLVLDAMKDGTHSPGQNNDPVQVYTPITPYEGQQMWFLSAD